MEAEAATSPLRVSSRSVWSDRFWRYPNEVPGQNRNHSEIDWAFDLGDGQSLLGPSWETLLNELRAFVYTARESPVSGSPIAAGRLKNVGSALSELAAFLAECGIESLTDVDSSVSWDFVEWLGESYVNRGLAGRRSRKLVHSAMMRVLEVIPLIWRQRNAMRKLGYASLAEEPFDGRPPYSVVKDEMHLRRSGRLKPVPDDVAFPAMNRALWMCGVPALEVIELQNQVLSALQQGTEQRASTPDQYRLARGCILKFQFSSADDGEEAWRPPILSRQTRTLIDGRTVTLSAIQALRHLITTIVSAAVLGLQSQTGMRSHELCGLQDDSEPEKEDPSCLSSRLTSDGLLECFYLKGRTAKRGPSREVEWLVGSRPAGSSYTPPSVAALRVLKRLLAPWRALGATNSLLLTFSAGRGLPRGAESIGRMTSCTLTYLQKEFVHEHVDLSHLPPALHHEFVERHALRGHRWRTTFAQNIYSFHSGLVPALRDHFKHMSDAITISGYIGTDSTLLDTCDSMRTLTTAQLLLGYSMGSGPAVGGMARLVSKYAGELAAAIRTESGACDLDRAVEFVIRHDLEIWNIHYGRCFMGLLPHKSVCNDLKGIPVLLRRRPALEFRSPSVCAGCRVFAAYHEHLEFWRQRKTAAEAVLAAAKTAGPGALRGLRVEQGRYQIADAFVRGLEAGGPGGSDEACQIH